MSNGTRRALGVLGVAMIGDVVAYALGPKRYVRLWAWPKGPRWYQRILDVSANKRSGIVLGVFQAAIGLEVLRLAERG